MASCPLCHASRTHVARQSGRERRGKQDESRRPVRLGIIALSLGRCKPFLPRVNSNWAGQPCRSSHVHNTPKATEVVRRVQHGAKGQQANTDSFT